MLVSPTVRVDRIWSYGGVSWNSAVITTWSDRPSGGCSRVVTWFGMSDMTRSRML